MAFFGFGLGKERDTEQGIRMLTQSQQDELTLALAAAQTQDDRNKIISDKLIQFAAADKASENKTTMMIYIVTGSVAIIMLFGILIYNKKTK